MELLIFQVSKTKNIDKRILTAIKVLPVYRNQTVYETDTNPTIIPDVSTVYYIDGFFCKKDHMISYDSYPKIVVGKYSIANGSSDFPDYMTTTNADIKFGIQNIAYDPLSRMDGCLYIKDDFLKYIFNFTKSG